MGKIKLLLDSDLGCDIDDCFAVGYALKQDKFELMGITTNGGCAHRRAMWAEALLYNAGREDVPVHVGSGKPLLGDAWGGMTEWQFKQVEKYPHRALTEENTAVEFMRRTIEAHPHEITLACIGLLTNAALLFATYPHIPSLLRGMTVMGGRYADNEFCDIKKWGKNEYNIVCDPYSAAVVFSAPVREIRVVGVETTCQYRWERADAIRRAAQTGYMKPVADALALTMPTTEPVWFHDSLSLMMLADDGEMSFERGSIRIELDDPNDRGASVFTPSERGRHLLLADYSPEIFFEKYCETTGMSIK